MREVTLWFLEQPFVETVEKNLAPFVGSYAAVIYLGTNWDVQEHILQYCLQE